MTGAHRHTYDDNMTVTAHDGTHYYGDGCDDPHGRPATGALPAPTLADRAIPQPCRPRPLIRRGDDYDQGYDAGYTNGYQVARDMLAACGWLPPPDVSETDRRPHSRACGWQRHDHGPACHTNCPTCAGRKQARGVVIRQMGEYHADAPGPYPHSGTCGCPLCVAARAYRRAVAAT